MRNVPADRPACEALVVDDDLEIRGLLVEWLQELELIVETVSDGVQAIAAIEREPTRFGVVVTDIVMPGADGLAVLRAAKAVNPDLPVVLITGCGSPQVEREAVRLGASGYLRKPFTAAQVERTLGDLLRC